MCAECGYPTRDAGEYHPYVFCVLWKAGIDPWQTVRDLNHDLGLVPYDAVPARPPLIKDMWWTRDGEDSPALGAPSASTGGESS